jgi:hypothetical protein
MAKMGMPIRRFFHREDAKDAKEEINLGITSRPWRLRGGNSFLRQAEAYTPMLIYRP